jgi:hypothetical protein
MTLAEAVSRNGWKNSEAYLWVLIGLIDILELENLCTFGGRINRKW